MSDLDDAPDLITSRADFEDLMDEFLEKYEVISGKMRPTLPGSATDKLDAFRKALGEAKIREAEQSEPEGDDILMPLDVDDRKDRWDCETILSESACCRFEVSHFESLPLYLSQLHTAASRITHGSSVRGTTNLHQRSDWTLEPVFPPCSRNKSSNSLPQRILRPMKTKIIFVVSCYHITDTM